MTNPIISFIFLYWNAEDWTLKSLESINKYMTLPYELIIVNNGSDEFIVEAVQELAEEIKKTELCVNLVIVNNETNLGVSKGFNAGRKYVNPETQYVSYFANDWAITPGWDKAMIQAINEHPKYGMMTSCTNWGTGSMMHSTINPVRWQEPIFLDVNLINFWEELEKITEKQSKNNLLTPNTFVCVGFFLKKQCYDDVGDFDERIQTANDVWFTRVANKLGWISMTCWYTYIQHGFHQSFSQINDPKTFSNIKPKEAQDFKIMAADPRCNI